MSNKIYYTGFGSPPSVDLSKFFYGNDTKLAPEPDKPTCPVTHRVKTDAEVGLGVSLFEKIGGQEALYCGPAQGGRSEYLVGEGRYELYPDWLVSTTHHSFVQNGCRKSWCSNCDHEGLFDFESGTFKPV